MADHSRNNPVRSPNVAQRPMGEPAPLGRKAALSTPQDSRTPLRELFADLMAYVLFFLESPDRDARPFTEVRQKITSLVEEQERRVKTGEVPWEAYDEARFAVLSWVDEMVLTSAWSHRSQWQHLMLATHRTLNAGEEFYERLKNLPTEARDVREIYYLCLELGYLGEHALADSAGHVRELKRGLYRQLSGAPNDIRQQYPRIFPEAYRKASRKTQPAAGPWIHPAWFGVAVLVPLVLFAAYFFLLRRETNRILAALAAPVQAAPQPQVNWCRALIDELRRKGIEAREERRGMVVTLPDLLFEVGKSELSQSGAAKLQEVAQVVRRYAPDRSMEMEGHASRERGVLDELNQRLSEDRAKRAADVLISEGIPRGNITTRGLGSSTPVASNETDEGRRKNRRVEIVIEKGSC